MIEAGWRYGIYAGLAIVGGVSYALLDGAEDGPAQNSASRAHGQGELPPLNALSSSGRAAVKRDLFALPAPPAPVAVAADVATPPPPPPAPVDRLADIQVFGVVSQKGEQAILIKSGADIVTIRMGERFGKDDALEVGMVEAGQIRVLDRAANVSKTFTLSEE
jgi:hypothetical protein